MTKPDCKNFDSCLNDHKNIIASLENKIRLYRFDYLTGLKQRHDFEVETAKKMKHEDFFLCMYDVTGLHKINRERGYSCGDALVKSVANQIQHTENLVEVYRIGGDEFMAIYTTRPNPDEILDATGAYVYSLDFNCFYDMVDAVDKLVVNKKTKLCRRRAD